MRLVFAREFKARMLTKANIVSMAIMLALIVAGTVVAGILMNREDSVPSIHIALDSDAADLGPFLETNAAESGTTLTLSTMAEDEARSLLDGTAPRDASAAEEPALDAFVGGGTGSPRVIVADPNDLGLQGIIAGALQSRAIDDAVRGMGGDPEVLRRALAGAEPVIESTAPTDEEKFGPAYFVATVALVVLLIALIAGCNMIAMGVVEEKSSRVVEILLATIRPTHLLAGKILGVGAYGLFQVAVVGGSLTASLFALGVVDDIHVDVGGTLALLILWFLLGYTMYALLFGAFASLVSRQEDVGAVTTPLTFLVIGPYYAATFLVPAQPDSTLVRVLSEIPFLSPFMMPMRSAVGGVPGWEMALSILISLATIPALIWVAARMYQRGVLHMGGRLKLIEALRRPV
jgi:ABC-2 type transport system permease protein